MHGTCVGSRKRYKCMHGTCVGSRKRYKRMHGTCVGSKDIGCTTSYKGRVVSSYHVFIAELINCKHMYY